MSYLTIDSLPPWALILIMFAHLCVGVMLGVLYFRSIWWNARQFTKGGRAMTIIAFMVGRTAILAAVLMLASLGGAATLLATALGILIARFFVMRRIRQDAA